MIKIMEIDKIKELGNIENYRLNDSNGYITNKSNVTINTDLKDVTIVNSRSTCIKFDKFIIAAILEAESELIRRAFELEEIEYKKVKKLAKREAIELLTGE